MYSVFDSQPANFLELIRNRFSFKARFFAGFKRSKQFRQLAKMESVINTGYLKKKDLGQGQEGISAGQGNIKVIFDP